MTLLSPRVTVADAFRQTFAALLKARYDDSGVELTKVSGLSSSTITRLLNGERGASFRVLERVRVAFGVSPAGLFDPDAALAQLGLRRNTDTESPANAHTFVVGVDPMAGSASPLGEVGGIDVHGLPNQELLTALLTYWGTMSPERRLELVGHGLRLAGTSNPAVAAGFGRG